MQHLPSNESSVVDRSRSILRKQFSPALFFFGVGCIIFVVWFICYVIGREVGDTIRPIPQGQACTMDAKICPDGTSVGRSGPNCVFAPCPVQ